jgi:hypothetical protein
MTPFPYTVAFKSFEKDNDRIRFCLMKGEKELLPASLPPPTKSWSYNPTRTLLESLTMCLDVLLRVVLFAIDPADGYSLDLTDEQLGLRNIFYEVELIERGRRHWARLRGVDDFGEIQRLYVFDRCSGGGR